MFVNSSDLLPCKQYPQLSPEPFLELLPVPALKGLQHFTKRSPSACSSLRGGRELPLALMLKGQREGEHCRAITITQLSLAKPNMEHSQKGV